MTTDEFKQQAEGLRLQLISVAQRYLGTTDEAEDIVQDTMIKLWLMREQLTSPVIGFASIVTRNLCIDYLRKKHPMHLEVEKRFLCVNIIHKSTILLNIKAK